MTELQKYLEQPYTVLLRRDADGDYVAKVTELPGCSAHGKTSGEALENLDEAKALWIQDCLENGETVPLDAGDEESLPSGKWLQRVPRKLHRKLQALAKNDGVSLNQLVTALLAEAVGERTRVQHTSQAFVRDAHGSFAATWPNDPITPLDEFYGRSAWQDWQVVNVTAGAQTYAATAGHEKTSLVEILDQWSAWLPDKITLKPEKNEKEKHRNFAAIEF